MKESFFLILVKGSAATQCGAPGSWNYGPGWGDITADCDTVDDKEKCKLTCQNGLFAWPVDFVVCDENVLFPCPIGIDPAAPDEGMSITCEVTPCGGIEQFGFNDGDMSATCDSNGCSFTCNDGTKMPNTFSIACNAVTKQWVNEFNMDNDPTSRPLSCIPPVDSPCGDLAVQATLDAVVTVTCEPFVSVFDSSEHHCTLTCPAGQYVNGPSEYTCTNNNFTPAGETSKCCERECCEIPDYNDLLAKFNESWSDDDHIATFTCKDATQIMTNPATGLPLIDTRIQCDTYTQQWDTDQHALLQAAECRHLSCQEQLVNGVDMRTAVLNNINVRNGASIGPCADGACPVECSDPSYPYPQPAVIDCDNLAAVVAADLVVCGESKCGETSSFSYGPNWNEVTVSCDANTDVCSLSCNSGNIYPIGEVMCLDGQLHPSPDSLDISCADTICGDFDVLFGFDPTTMTYTCDATSCSVSCNDATKVANTNTFYCHQLGLQFLNPYDMHENIRPLQCVDPHDTPCGQIDDMVDTGVYAIDLDAIRKCDPWVSIYDQGPHEHHCTMTCPPGKKLFGRKTVTCKNGVFDLAQTGDDVTRCWKRR